MIVFEWIFIFLLLIDPFVYMCVVKKDGAKDNLWPFSGYWELMKYFKRKTKAK